MLPPFVKLLLSNKHLPTPGPHRDSNKSHFSSMKVINVRLQVPFLFYFFSKQDIAADTAAMTETVN